MLSEEDCFLKAIEENPDDDWICLIYADWLEERGDSRGPSVRARCSQIRRIKEKLERLRTLDQSHSRFGAQEHQYRLEPCLKGVEIRAFESANGVKLPEDYRDFLLRVAGGGAGPDYGLVALCVPFNDSRLKEPFLPDEVDSDGYPTCMSGFLDIGDKGCGYRNLLVLSGPERGKVWYDYRMKKGGFEPTGSSFLGWYEDWLDEGLGEPPASEKERPVILWALLDRLEDETVQAAPFINAASGRRFRACIAEAASERLIRCASRPSIRRRFASLLTAAGYGGQAISILLDMYGQGDEQLRQGVIGDLAACAEPGSLIQAILKLASTYPDLSERLILATSQEWERKDEEHPRLVPLLSEILSYASIEGRKLGLLALYRLGRGAVGGVSAMRNCLLDSDPVVRRMAQNALRNAEAPVLAAAAEVPQPRKSWWPF